jgi:hypothetical protein
MLRRSISITFLVSLFVLVAINSHAQSDDPPKFEVGAEFSSITLSDSFARRTEPGFGGRFTFNLNKSVALEAATYFFPQRNFNCCRASGTLTEGLFGVKVGKRFEKWGIFGKARPGFASFSQGDVQFTIDPPGVNVAATRATNFAFDVGAVVEFYPTKRIVTRFDLGDTMIHFGRQNITTPFIDASGNIGVFQFTLPATTQHNFQFSAGIGFRF